MGIFSTDIYFFTHYSLLNKTKSREKYNKTKIGGTANEFIRTV